MHLSFCEVTGCIFFAARFYVQPRFRSENGGRLTVKGYDRGGQSWNGRNSSRALASLRRLVLASSLVSLNCITARAAASAPWSSTHFRLETANAILFFQRAHTNTSIFNKGADNNRLANACQNHGIKCNRLSFGPSSSTFSLSLPSLHPAYLSLLQAHTVHAMDAS